MLDRILFGQYKHTRVLITGGLGFIGSSLAHRLVDLGAVVTLYDNAAKQSRRLFNIWDIQKKVRLVQGDLRDEIRVRSVVSKQDVIFNLAALSSHVESNNNPLGDLDVNCYGQLVFLTAITKFAPKAKIVFAGSRAQYGKPQKLPVTEDSPMSPVDMYGAHKLLGEYYHFLFAKHHGLRVTCLRKTNTYGPRHQMRHAQFGVQNYFIRLALDNQPIVIYGDGKQLRDYTYIDDVVHAYLLCGMQKKSDGNVYVLGSGEPIRLVDYAKKVIQLTGSGSIKFTPFPKERQVIEIGDYIADYRKIRRDLGWKPAFHLHEGLQKTLEFYRKHRREYWIS